MDIKTLVNFDKLLGPNIARLLRGEAGLGKSSVIKQLAHQKGTKVIDLRLSELEPGDLVGYPYPEDGVTKYARPYWWPTDSEERVCLFLDEVDRCREDMQPAAMQLTLDRRAGGRVLPASVEVWAACNGECYLTMPMDQALVNRFVVIDFTPTVEEWLDWATENEINQSVIEFIRSYPSQLDIPENLIGKPNIVIPSRRSWGMLGKILNKLPCNVRDEKSLLQYAATCVGYEAAAAFSSWVQEHYCIVSPQQIFAGTAKAVDLNIVQIASVAVESADMFLDEARTREEQYNCLKFYMGAGTEAFASLFEALDPDAALVIASFPDIDAFILQSRRV